MIRDKIIEQLRIRGYDAVPSDVTKNSVLKHGICIKEGNISPCIYLDELLQQTENINELVEQIIYIYETNKSINIDLKQIMKKDYILSHLFVGLQRTSEEQLIKQPCPYDGLEQYLYIRDSSENKDNWSIKLNKTIMKQADVTLDEAWKAAQHNTFSPKETVIQSMCEVMNEILGYNYEDERIFPMYIISNRCKIRGASQALDRKAIQDFAAKHGTNELIVLPSSIHEMILVIPDAEEIDLSMFSNIVTEINCSQVAPEERLTDRAYIIHMENGQWN